MNSVERVKSICKERRIPISKLEKDLGFSNGYIGQLRKGVFPADRLAQIADYLSLSTEYLLTGKEDSDQPTQQPEGDDIKKEFDRFRGMLERGEIKPLCYDNTPAGPKEIKALLKMLDASEEMIRDMLSSKDE